MSVAETAVRRVEHIELSDHLFRQGTRSHTQTADDASPERSERLRLAHLPSSVSIRDLARCGELHCRDEGEWPKPILLAKLSGVFHPQDDLAGVLQALLEPTELPVRYIGYQVQVPAVRELSDRGPSVNFRKPFDRLPSGHAVFHEGLMMVVEGEYSHERCAILQFRISKAASEIRATNRRLVRRPIMPDRATGDLSKVRLTVLGWLHASVSPPDRVTAKGHSSVLALWRLVVRRINSDARLRIVLVLSAAVAGIVAFSVLLEGMFPESDRAVPIISRAIAIPIGLALLRLAEGGGGDE